MMPWNEALATSTVPLVYWMIARDQAEITPVLAVVIASTIISRRARLLWFRYGHLDLIRLNGICTLGIMKLRGNLVGTRLRHVIKTSDVAGVNPRLARF